MTSGKAIDPPFSIQTTSKNVPLKTRLRTLKRQVSGQEGSSQKLCRPVSSGKPSQCTKTISCAFQTGTPATSYGRAGDFRTEPVQELTFEQLSSQRDRFATGD